MSSEQYDVVVFGATGYTGLLCAQYLAEYPGNSKPRWAIAGRNPERLEALRKKHDLPSNVGIIVADVADEASIEKMVSQTKSIVNVVGPFRQLGGEKVVKACVKLGKVYTDLSGESGFNASLTKYHEEAKKTGAIIVPSSGFDSLPFDLTVWLAASQLDAPVSDAYVGVKMQGGVSGGTLRSGLDMAETGIWQLQNCRPDILSPLSGDHHLNFQPAVFMPHLKAYASWIPLSIHNHRIVNRTWGILATEGSNAKGLPQYAANFQYRDGVVVGNRVLATIISLVAKTMISSMLYFAPVRWIMDRAIPRGYGPAENRLVKGSLMDVRTFVSASSSSSAPGVVTRMYSVGDPGYYLTARMIVESALTFALEDRASLPAVAKHGGVLTPATAGGEALAKRLRNAGFTIETSAFRPKL